jgi:phosphonate degradation associated HDIG domain protein
MPLTIPAICQLFEQAGARLYGGEAITQSEHALQSAFLAEQAGHDDALVIACLLHDLGHMLFEQQDDELAAGQDDLHQFKIVPFLRGLMPAAVIEPIRLHVDAKRYLCQREPGYLLALSEASQLSLALQGGVMDDAAAERFVRTAHAASAIALRRCDDAAKVVGLRVPPLDHYLARLQALAT